MPAAYALVADIDPRRADVVSRCVVGRKLTPVTVRDGEQARARITGGELPTLVVTNLSLPLVDGFQLLRDLRSVARPEESAAIAISGFSILNELANRLRDELGIVRTLSATANRDEIADAVGDALASLGRAALPVNASAPTQPALEISRPDDDTLWEAAARSIAHRFNAAVAVISRISDSQTVRVHLSGAASFDADVPRGRDSWWQAVVSEGRPFALSDVGREPDRGVRDFTGPLVRAFHAVPLLRDGRIAGAVAVVHAQPVVQNDDALAKLVDAAASLTLSARAAAEDHDEAESTDAYGRYVESLWRMALTDPLTGLNNRRGAEDALQREFGRARRMNTALSVAMFDIDAFKSLNDKYGHAAGDTVLRDVADVLRTAARASDLAARWGGEEFLVILPDVFLEGAVRFAERVRTRIEQLRFRQEFRVTISAGVAQHRPGEPVHGFLERADEQLYHAKAQGRNRVSSDSRY